jgi:hypothetical protein
MFRADASTPLHNLFWHILLWAPGIQPSLSTCEIELPKLASPIRNPGGCGRWIPHVDDIKGTTLGVGDHDGWGGQLSNTYSTPPAIGKPCIWLGPEIAKSATHQTSQLHHWTLSYAKNRESKLHLHPTSTRHCPMMMLVDTFRRKKVCGKVIRCLLRYLT